MNGVSIFKRITVTYLLTQLASRFEVKKKVVSKSHQRRTGLRSGSRARHDLRLAGLPVKPV